MDKLCQETLEKAFESGFIDEKIYKFIESDITNVTKAREFALDNRNFLHLNFTVVDSYRIMFHELLNCKELKKECKIFTDPNEDTSIVILFSDYSVLIITKKHWALGQLLVLPSAITRIDGIPFINIKKSEKITKTVYKDSIEYTNEAGQLHNINDEPAMIYSFDSKKVWAQNGKTHRDGDKPATISDNVKEWYQNGKLHRDGDKPAVIFKDGTTYYYRNGEIYYYYPKPLASFIEIKKSAFPSGTIEHRNEKGELHNINDLPAIIHKDGAMEWWKNGVYHRDGDKPALDFDGFKRWHQNGKLHRDGDEPAIIHKNGAKEWYQNGERHRNGDKPAVILLNRKEWYQNGKSHRDGDKPAVIYGDGKEYYYRNGEQYVPQNNEKYSQELLNEVNEFTFLDGDITFKFQEADFISTHGWAKEFALSHSYFFDPSFKTINKNSSNFVKFLYYSEVKGECQKFKWNKYVVAVFSDKSILAISIGNSEYGCWKLGRLVFSQQNNITKAWFLS